MKNTAGVTSVEYEIRMTDSKSVNVFRKTLSPAEAFNPDLVSVGNFNTFSSDYEVGPGHVTVTLICHFNTIVNNVGCCCHFVSNDSKENDFVS